MSTPSNVNNASPKRNQQPNLDATNDLIKADNNFMPTPNADWVAQFLAATNSIDINPKTVTPAAQNNLGNALSQTKDNEPPIPQSVSPQIGENHVALNASISASFNENIQAGNGRITVTNNQGDSRSLNVHDTQQVIFSGNKITLKPLTSLASNSTYSVLVDYGAIVDEANNPFAGTSDPHVYTFSTLSLPTLNSLKYDDYSPTVLGEFNQAVKTGSGYVILSNHQGDERRIAINDPKQVAIYDTHFSIYLQKDLLPGKQYFLEFENNALLDKTDQPITLANIPTLSFTTPIPDAIPVPIRSIPNNDFPIVRLDDFIEIDYNVQVQAGTGHFILTNGQGDTRYIAANDKSQVKFFPGPPYSEAFGTGAVGSEKRVLIFPKDPLLANSQYSLGMEDNTVLNKIGLAAAAVATTNGLHFITDNDIQAPILADLTPQNNAQQVATDATIQAIFNEPIKAGIGNFILSNNLGDSRTIAVNDTSQVTIEGHLIEIKPLQKFQANAHYNLQFNAGIITDLSNHGILSSDESEGLNFSTAIPDTQNPKFIRGDAMQNSDGILDYPGAYSFSLQFDEPIKRASGNIVLRTSANEIYQFADTDYATPVLINFFDSSKLNIITTFSFKFQKNTHYDVFIDNGAVTDLAGNPFINDGKPIFSFDTVNDITPPSFVSVEDVYLSLQDANIPANGIGLKFNDLIERGSGNITLTNAEGDKRVIPVTDREQVFIDSSYTLTISPSQKLQPNSHYTISLDAGVVLDNFQNANVATQAIEYYSRLAPEAATNNPVAEINRGGVQGIYDNLDLLVLHFNQPVQWHGGFSLSQHSIGEHDFVLSPDGLSLSVELDSHSTITHGDSIYLSGIDANGLFNQYVTFTL